MPLLRPRGEDGFLFHGESGIGASRQRIGAISIDAILEEAIE